MSIAQITQAFLASPTVKQVLNESGSALAAITVLKKVCDHPALLSQRATATLLRTGTRGDGKLGRNKMVSF